VRYVDAMPPAVRYGPSNLEGSDQIPIVTAKVTIHFVDELREYRNRRKFSPIPSILLSLLLLSTSTSTSLLSIEEEDADDDNDERCNDFFAIECEWDIDDDDNDNDLDIVGPSRRRRRRRLLLSQNARDENAAFDAL